MSTSPPRPALPASIAAWRRTRTGSTPADFLAWLHGSGATFFDYDQAEWAEAAVLLGLYDDYSRAKFLENVAGWL